MGNWYKQKISQVFTSFENSKQIADTLLKQHEISAQPKNPIRGMQISKGWNGYAIYRDGKILGGLSIRRLGKQVFIYNLYVDPASRGLGFASQLIQSVLKDFPTVFATVETTNVSAISLFKQLGFVETQNSSIDNLNTNVNVPYITFVSS